MKRFVKHPNAAQKLALGLRRDFGRNSIAVDPIEPEMELGRAGQRFDRASQIGPMQRFA
jgi:hypothetical protein